MKKARIIAHKKKQLKLLDPIFKQRVIVLLNYTPEEYEKFEARMGIKNSEPWDYNKNAFTTHLSADKEPNLYLMVIPEFDWTIDQQATLIHEIIHTITRIWETNNIQFIPATQEFFAHSVDKLYIEIAKRLIKK